MKEYEYTNSQMAALIDEYIHKAKYRDILRDRFIDGLTFDEIAAKRDISTRNAQKIVYKYGEKVLKWL